MNEPEFSQTGPFLESIMTNNQTTAKIYSLFSARMLAAKLTKNTGKDHNIVTGKQIGRAHV